MRRAKVDANQAAIVAEFRARGASVVLLHRVGDGCPDLAVGYRGRNLFVEVVGPDKHKRFPPHGLSPDQVEWHRDWRGSVAVVYDAAGVEALLLGVDMRKDVGAIP